MRALSKNKVTKNSSTLCNCEQIWKQTFLNSPENYVHPPRVPSKRAFQRSLHESYQYMMKSMQDAINLEAHRRKKLQTALEGSLTNDSGSNKEDQESNES